MNELALETDVLTLTVLLPEDERERDAFLTHISNNGELCGSVALGAMNGNMINFVRIQDAIKFNEPAVEIYERLQAENAHQIHQAMASRANMVRSCGQPRTVDEVGRASNADLLTFGALMFALGLMVSYHVF
ncbi:hypothetical protein KXJ72_17455 (plasmid) [Comamonas aquatica]|nr:hypothetical protein KXJ72_17455 [Comamonas aquatica]